MSFTFTEDQKLLSESADRFVLDDYNFETRRKIIGQDGGFDRDIKMDWTVAALSREELIPQYQKLNFYMLDV